VILRREKKKDVKNNDYHLSMFIGLMIHNIHRMRLPVDVVVVVIIILRYNIAYGYIPAGGINVFFIQMAVKN